MLQWRPGSKTEVLWNDREGDHFVCHILDVTTAQAADDPTPGLHGQPRRPLGRRARFPPRERHAGPATATRPPRSLPRPVRAPQGLGHLRRRSGDRPAGADRLAGRHRQASPIPRAICSKAKHWFNHLLVNPDGTRFEFLHRWRTPSQSSGFTTRMFTAAPDGSDIRAHRPLRPDLALHLARSAAHPGLVVAAVARRRLLPLRGQGGRQGRGRGPGRDDRERPLHATCPATSGFSTTPIPDRQRNQNVYLYHVATGRRVPLGSFLLPKEYTGEWRCDTHPRFSPDGRSVVIDSPHTGEGRQMHLIELRSIVG